MKTSKVTVVSKHMPGDYDIEYASPWAGANYWPVGKPGSNLQRFERTTWPELARICREVPEAGIHFQESRVYGRSKDAGTATGQWFDELCKEDAWFKNVVPNNLLAFTPVILRTQVMDRSSTSHETSKSIPTT
jgi:D-amino-acid oxidase